MARNLSVEQFKQLMASVPKAVATELKAGVREEGERLAETMRSAVSVKTGRLRDSIRVEGGRSPLSVLVKAGGAATTVEARAGSGKSYDYSLGIEFSNLNTPAAPFFWPSYRLKKRFIRSALSKKMKIAIGKVVNLK
ncbi:MAG: HK97 gp10 family phage protein [Pyrinomonadaceae bacterium]|nr:HK97 gp10 family phage protein [Pyrinomonadaceae bacterium]